MLYEGKQKRVEPLEIPQAVQKVPDVPSALRATGTSSATSLRLVPASVASERTRWGFFNSLPLKKNYGGGMSAPVAAAHWLSERYGAVGDTNVPVATVYV